MGRQARRVLFLPPHTFLLQQPAPLPHNTEEQITLQRGNISMPTRLPALHPRERVFAPGRWISGKGRRQEGRSGLARSCDLDFKRF